jgi:hypothetical protein
VKLEGFAQEFAAAFERSKPKTLVVLSLSKHLYRSVG